MSEIKNGGLDQYGVEPFDQQHFETAAVKGVSWPSLPSRQILKNSNKCSGDDEAEGNSIVAP